MPFQRWSGCGSLPSLLLHDPKHRPVSAEQLSLSLPDAARQVVTKREGNNAPQTRASPRSGTSRRIATNTNGPKQWS